MANLKGGLQMLFILLNSCRQNLNLKLFMYCITEANKFLLLMSKDRFCKPS